MVAHITLCFALTVVIFSFLCLSKAHQKHICQIQLADMELDWLEQHLDLRTVQLKL